MEDLITFVIVVLIILGVLQIILFYKIWIMTDNVKEMKEQFVGNPDQWSLNKAILKSIMMIPFQIMMVQR